MSQVFFISDTHFGHRAICKYRSEFKTPEEHDETIVTNWNKVVNKRSFVWVLGDMCIKNKDYDMDKLISRLNGTIYLITGSHCHLPYYNHNKIVVRNGLTKKYGYWLSHCPIHPTELRGKKNIHGHVHYKSLPDNNYINVCCEVINYKPISLEEIRKKEKEYDS
ncbi:MAG: hypothetical protein GY861_11740 [bacterium]|nr:hypothetical protein [bacterium]